MKQQTSMVTVAASELAKLAPTKAADTPTRITETAMMPPSLSANQPPEYPHDAAHEHGQGRVIFRFGLLDAKPIMKEGGQIGAHAHISAEGDDVNGVEHPAIRLPQALDVVDEGLVALAVRRFLSEDEHGQERQQHEHSGEAVDGVPAVGLGKLGREERGDGRATIAGPGNTHRQALDSGGNHPEPSASATPKLAPAMPNSTPMASTPLNELT